MIGNLIGSLFGANNAAVKPPGFEDLQNDIAKQNLDNMKQQKFMMQQKMMADQFESVINLVSAGSSKSKKISEDFKQ